MTRFALYAGAATLALVATAAQAQTGPARTGQGPSGWPQQVAQQDGGKLIAALDACQDYAEQARRQVCETKARRGNGGGIQLSIGRFTQPGDRSDDRQDP